MINRMKSSDMIIMMENRMESSDMMKLMKYLYRIDQNMKRHRIWKDRIEKTPRLEFLLKAYSITNDSVFS